MSADNYLYVFKHDDKFFVTMLWASCEYSDDVLDQRGNNNLLENFANVANYHEPYPLVIDDQTPAFDTLADAIEYAEAESEGEYPDHWTEYGYSISPKIERPTYVELLRKQDAEDYVMGIP